MPKPSWFMILAGACLLAPVSVAKAQVLIDADAPQPAGYWIGIQTRAVPGEMRAHLKLPEGQGLLVEQVLPRSPAAEAKLQRHDVLLKAGDRPLREVGDLVKVVDASQGKKLAMEVLRAGKTMTVEVTPAKRPADMAQALPEGPWPAGPEWDNLRKWLEQVQPGRPGQPPMRFRFFQPGAVLPPVPPMPDNLTVTITRQGQQPAKIHVARGEEKWDVSENELDKLPADIRPYVQRMLNPGALRAMESMDFFPAPAEPGHAASPRLKPEPGAAHLPSRVDKQLDEMSRQLEQLRKSVDDLRQRLPETPKK